MCIRDRCWVGLADTQPAQVHAASPATGTVAMRVFQRRWTSHVRQHARRGDSISVLVDVGGGLVASSADIAIAQDAGSARSRSTGDAEEPSCCVSEPTTSSSAPSSSPSSTSTVGRYKSLAAAATFDDVSSSKPIHIAAGRQFMATVSALVDSCRQLDAISARHRHAIN